LKPNVEMPPSLLWRIGNPVSFVAVIIANAAVGSKIGAVSDDNEVLITPGGWAFSIWGIIYTLLSCFCIWQCIHKTE